MYNDMKKKGREWLISSLKSIICSYLSNCNCNHDLNVIRNSHIAYFLIFVGAR